MFLADTGRVELHLGNNLFVLMAARWLGIGIPSYHLALRL